MKKITFVAYLLPIGVTIILLVIGCKGIIPAKESIPFMTITPNLAVTTIQTPTLTLTNTPFPINTATTQEREDFLRGYLSDDSNCNLPCWWNIIPGETAWRDVEQLLNYLGARVSSIPGYRSDSTFHGAGGFDFIDISGHSVFNRIGFDERNGIVDATLISSEGYNNPKEFHTLWANYSPQEIMKKYSTPDRIWLNVPSSSGSVYRDYFLWLFYDELGFMIRYHGEVLSATILHICPKLEGDGDIGKIDLNLQSPNEPLSLERFDAILEDVRKGTDTGKLRIIRSIQEASGIDEKEFYRIFVQEDPACFNTPQDIWVVR